MRRYKSPFSFLSSLILCCILSAIACCAKPSYASIQSEAVTIPKSNIHSVFKPNLYGKKCMQGGTITEKYFVYGAWESDGSSNDIVIADRKSGKVIKKFNKQWSHMGTFYYEWGSNHVLVVTRGSIKGCIDLSTRTITSGRGLCPALPSIPSQSDGLMHQSDDVHNGYYFKALDNRSNAGYIAVFDQNKKLVKSYKIPGSNVDGRWELENVSVDGSTGDVYADFHKKGTRGADMVYRIDASVFGGLTNGNGQTGTEDQGNGARELTELEETIWSQNNILFYEPCGESESSACGISVSGSSIEEKIWSGLKGFLTDEQAAGVMGNMAHEGGLSPARHEGSFINSSVDISSDTSVSYGLGLIQWSFGRRVNMYNYIKQNNANLIKYLDEKETYGNLGGQDFLEKAGNDSDVNMLIALELCFLKKELDENKSYNGIYKTSSVEEATQYFLEHVEIPKNPTLSAHPERLTSAKEYYSKFSTGTGTSTPSDTTDADSSTSASSSNSDTSTEKTSPTVSNGYDTSNAVNTKAFELANQTREESKKGPTAEYKAALEATGGDKGGGDKYARSGQSCDMFVAVVLKASKVDENVPWGSTTTQATYFAEHPEIYTEVQGDPNEESTYQPGDIRISSGHHVEIYGQKDGKGYILSASHGDRWAGYTEFFGAGDEYKIYRTQSTPACVSASDCTQGNMNLNATAVCLAWPYGTDSSKYACHGKYKSHGCTNGSATKAFEQAIDTVYPNRGWSDCPHVGASCDVGTATAIRYSGVDPKFPRGLAEQKKYAEKHPEIWEVIKWDGKDKSVLKGGDVIYNVGGGAHHIYMYVEDSNGNLYRAESGLCNTFFHLGKYRGAQNSSSWILRAKNAKNSNIGVDVKNGVSGSGGTSTTTNTSSTNNSASKAQNASDLNSIALKLAWPADTKASKYKYPGGDGVAAWREYYNSVYPKKNQTSPTKKGASCSVWVASVLMHAGLVSYDDPYRSEDTLLETLSKDKDWEEIKTDDGGKAQSNYQPGDVVFVKSSDGASHVMMYVEVNDKGYIAQANANKEYGHLINYQQGKGNRRIFRYKGFASTTADACDACAGKEDNSGTGLKEGGFQSVEEAKKFMEAYRQEAAKKKKGSYSFQGAYIFDAGCIGGTLNNCVAFSQWFLNKYTSIGPKWTNTVNGSNMVKHLGRTKGLKTGSEPRPYAVFSTSTYNHTGVILGVTEDSVIVGEASCHNGYTDYWPGVGKWSFSEAKSKGMTYAYTDDILTTGGI